MSPFTSIKELITTLYREHKLLEEMFGKRKSLAYHYDFAMELVEMEGERIQFLVDKGVLRENGAFLEVDDQFLLFFEQVLAVNEEINTAYIHESIKLVKQHMDYFLKENNESRKYGYLKTVKNTFRKIGLITIRNVVDLKRNLDNTFKNEPNYKVKKAKLENLDQKRQDIRLLIGQTEVLLTEEEVTFFKTAQDEELTKVITQLILQLNECQHNLIEIQRQVIEYLNQIQYQSRVIEKLRQIKYLKDQFELKSKTDILEVLAGNHAVVFEPRPVYRLKLSLEALHTDAAYESILLVAKRKQAGVKARLSIAGDISAEYLETEIEEEVFINYDELKNNFLASGNHLFDFVMAYNYPREFTFEEKVTLYCRMVSQFESEFSVEDNFGRHGSVEYAMVFPG